MKLYRDIQPGETLQAEDERMSGNSREWVPVYSGSIGQPAPADLLAFYRRPANLPFLQPVTPESMAELEGREVIGVLFVDGYGVQIASYNSSRGWWWCGGIGKLDRPTRGWFIELSTIPEVQQ